MSLIAEKGPAGFTFAEAARSAGVSPAAPYRHFRDRDDLMADVARQGFTRFEAMLARAWNDGLPDALTAFGQIGKAYLAFARTEPAYYSAMFESGLPLDAHPDLQQAGDRAFAILKTAAEAICRRLPPGRSPPPLMVALHLWSLAHGIAALFGRGDAARRKLPMSAEDLLEAGLLVYLDGLGLNGPLDRFARTDMLMFITFTWRHGWPSSPSSTSSASRPGSRCTVLAFCVWWPLGFATLAFAIGSGRMGCGRRGRFGTWHNLERGWRRRGSGRMRMRRNRAFAEYRDQTLRRLEEEEREFRDFLDRLRMARDKAEFDQFMAERRGGDTGQPTAV